MSDETPPRDPGTGALTRPERGSLPPLEPKKPDVDAPPVELADQFEVSVKQVGSRSTTRPPAGVELRTKVLFFVIGALWGAVIGGTIVALLKVPAPSTTPSPSDTTAPTPAGDIDP
jgi:hypothetical protein